MNSFGLAQTDHALSCFPTCTNCAVHTVFALSDGPSILLLQEQMFFSLEHVACMLSGGDHCLLCCFVITAYMQCVLLVIA